VTRYNKIKNLRAKQKLRRRLLYPLSYGRKLNNFKALSRLLYVAGFFVRDPMSGTRFLISSLRCHHIMLR
jgi:hypothetical protein